MSLNEEEETGEALHECPERSFICIEHPGLPPKERSRFANVSKPDYPKDLWKQGKLIYHFTNKEKCLPDPKSPDDKILRFDSRFESGNLARVYCIDDYKYHLILEYDSDGSAQWFYFRITNAQPNVKYTFYVSGFHKDYLIFADGHKCFMYSEKRAKEQNISWTRFGDYYNFAVTARTKTKKKRATVSFEAEFPYADDTYYLCLAIPYTYTDLRKHIANWSNLHPDIFKSETLCTSYGGREVPVINITNPNSDIPLVGKSCIFFTGRIHPGEANGSHVLHGLIEYLLSSDPTAKYILDHCIVTIVPMIAVDGVIEGSTRVNVFGDDLSRMWETPDPTRHPVITATKSLIAKTAGLRPVSLYIDFHGHMGLHGAFCYGCPNSEDEGLRNAEKMFPRLFALLSNEASWENCTFSFPKARKGAGRIVVRKEIGVVQSFTVETSFGGIISGPDAGILYDEELWHKVGERCGTATFHLLNPTASPLVAYVNKELPFFVSTSNRRAERFKEEQEEDTSKESASIDNDVDQKDDENSTLLKAHGSGKIYHYVQRNSFLNCTADKISTTKDHPLKPPKWKQALLGAQK
ncbi:Clan MC, family M14, Zinc carboxypeptidase-like metallopeptidase [Trichomonas vaginalis G3]|uniref:Clan MC, family M14, Zinc carboxypeptidase-like metallopeptidase n=1 Tax=Trichomonas vaginalis (strain ATCC PRA-98 / G3) TaxID=412133 RepID=A2DKQ3_TRIV3|nr:cytosolic carboxypeptidase family [Trichomonas vaginalis G3]EAY19036.1 Clan MC, family M14, Zinc carboxypeptidase-like metallopeptidase [Trichomonas vaginalis G3]KAI5521170.1 cytosolic carboxypeptidase family [Trichomonas vaginalis G3]|eukprot:XP_001580022.1 Clan MC, family M14, Zinc carboxypeptidase-like metallopeptidase [Trichomonas vaginalis G3]